MNAAPIGIFDSGVGGLTVKEKITELLPCENIIYYGDTAHFPYGIKTREEVTGYARAISRYLIGRGVKAIVIACNTATAIACETLRRECCVPVIGVINAGARSAASASESGIIGVIATEGTVKSEAYLTAIHRIRPEAVVIQKACTKFVPLVEEGKCDTQEARDAADEYLTELCGKGIDTLVLGCTHFPYLSKIISEKMGENVQLIDTACETAAELKELLIKEELLNDSGIPGTREIIMSGQDS